MIQVLYSYEAHILPPPEEPRLTFTVTPKNIRAVTFNGRVWREYEIAKSCSMTVEGETPDNCMIWECSGGSAGRGSSSNSGTRTGGGGGCGGYFASYQGLLADGAISIGAGGATGGAAGGETVLTMPGIGVTVLAPESEKGSNANGYGAISGATGGGAGALANNAGANTGSGTGQGNSTVPFLDTVNWYPLCGAGGGGALFDSNKHYKGGPGGSDGGGGGYVFVVSDINGGSGGFRGGGQGGNGTTVPTDGFDATDYGGGGGGGGKNSGTTHITGAGKGYQGVVIIRVPISRA
ncbi:hypothetical protein AGMMS49992_25800 [Clostridia bacterium]|nr:hypothetical protein AGMMS49992_25800 [Clostridia bacterium]